MPGVKVYRASRAIVSRSGSCPACSGLIKVGQPVVFLPPTTDLSARPVVHHERCVKHRL